MQAKTERRYGDTWIASDGRVCVAVRVAGARGDETVSMIVATGAENTYLPPEVLERVGAYPGVFLRTVDGEEVAVAPTLGPLLDRHRNDVAQGVLGMDVLGRLDAEISFRDGITVRSGVPG